MPDQPYYAEGREVKFRRTWNHEPKSKCYCCDEQFAAMLVVLLNQNWERQGKKDDPMQWLKDILRK